MFGAVQTLDLLFGRYAQTDGFLHDEEDEGHDDAGPCEDGNDAEELLAEEDGTAGVEETAQPCGCIGVCEETDCNGAPYTVCKVYAYSAYGVVDVELEGEQFNDYYYEDARNDANDGGSECVDCVTACGHTDQTSEPFRHIETSGLPFLIHV